MRRILIAIMLGLVPLASGCRQGPFRERTPRTPVSSAPAPSASGVATVDPRLSDLDRRASQLDSNNQDLHAQLAQSQRQVKLLSDEIALLKQRLTDTARQLKETQLANKQAESRLEGLQASDPRPGSATIRPNNSLLRSLKVADIAGLDVRQEQDVIRVLLPADEIFRPGTVDYQRGAEPLASRIGEALLRHYRRNKIVIEAHADDASARSGVTPHQLTASQALAVFDLLVRTGRMPSEQLSLMAFGDNHPRASNATESGRESNRRIELVVYPEEIN